MNIYSIKNEKLGFFNRPIYCESDHEALSYIQNILMSDSDRALYGLKGDLALYWLGSIDFNTGVIMPSLKKCDSLDEANLVENYAPWFICSLEEIFDSIPKERLKPALTSEDFKKVLSELEQLKKDCSELNDKIDNHKHFRKEILK